MMLQDKPVNPSLAFRRNWPFASVCGSASGKVERKRSDGWNEVRVQRPLPCRKRKRAATAFPTIRPRRARPQANQPAGALVATKIAPGQSEANVLAASVQKICDRFWIQSFFSPRFVEFGSDFCRGMLQNFSNTLAQRF